MAKNSKKAFTIVELIVAMGLLVLLVGLSSVVFTTTVKAHRKATATIEVTRNLRVLAEQLNADFQGLDKSAPLFIGFNRIDADTSFDTIHFFANGNFQTVRQYPVRYDSNNDGTLGPTDATRPEIIHGNQARIYYGHANSVDIVKDNSLLPDFEAYQVLSRKSHLFTAHEGLIYEVGEIPAITGTPMYGPFDTDFGIDPPAAAGSADLYENRLEFNTITLSDWGNALNYLDGGTAPANALHFIAECMDDDSRPYIDLNDYRTLHLLMTQGTLQFSIQWAYTPDDLDGTVSGFTTGHRWWPSTDPDGDGNDIDSDFGPNGMIQDQFGVYWGLPATVGVRNVDGVNWHPIQGCITYGVTFKDTFYPKALKFTFVLKDANRMFPEGKTFTHIVSLDN